MSPRAGRAKLGNGVREIPVSETTHPPGDRPCAGGESAAFPGLKNAKPCIFLPWPYRGWEAGGSGKFKGLLKVINQASGRAGIQIQIVSFLHLIRCASCPSGGSPTSEASGAQPAPRCSPQIRPTHTRTLLLQVQLTFPGRGLPDPIPGGVTYHPLMIPSLSLCDLPPPPGAHAPHFTDEETEALPRTTGGLVSQRWALGLIYCIALPLRLNGGPCRAVCPIRSMKGGPRCGR